MLKPVYLDYAATTPVDKAVVNEMSKYLSYDGIYGNPSSSHSFGFLAEQAVENARETIAEFLGCQSKEIVFTSGATESNNIAIKGIARTNKHKGNHIVTSSTEHKAVVDACKALEKEGFDITYINPDSGGKIATEQLRQAIKEDTILVSLMHVNNETGVIQNPIELGAITKERRVYFHVDAAQSIGKLPIDLSDSPIDFLSCSSHKIYGPKGVGFLYIKNRPAVHIQALIDGGGQEFGIRPGTLPTHQIAGLGKAIALASGNIRDDMEHAQKLRQKIIGKLNKLDDVVLNSPEQGGLPNIINASFLGVESQTLITSLQNEVAISTGSACSSGSIEPSHVLRSMGIEGDRLNSAVRISYGRYTTLDDLDNAMTKLISEVARIRDYSKPESA